MRNKFQIQSNEMGFTSEFRQESNFICTLLKPLTEMMRLSAEADWSPLKQMTLRQWRSLKLFRPINNQSKHSSHENLFLHSTHLARVVRLESEAAYCSDAGCRSGKHNVA